MIDVKYRYYGIYVFNFMEVIEKEY